MKWHILATRVAALGRAALDVIPRLNATATGRASAPVVVVLLGLLIVLAPDVVRVCADGVPFITDQPGWLTQI